MPPLPVDGHAPHTHWRNDTERRSKEASLCNNVLVFFLCGGLCNYQSIKTAAMGRKLDQKDSALLVLTSTTSEHLALTGSLVFYIYSSKLILLYSDQGRQTIENQLLHSLYQCMHIITSPLCGSLIKLDVLGVGFIWNIKHLEVVCQKIHLEKGLADWNLLSKLLYHNTLLSTWCMPSAESVPMYVLIFKGTCTAPCPLLHIQVMQDKQHIKKAHMCWVGVVHYHIS